MGISNSVPLFVIGFNKEKNELIVGEEKNLYKNDFYVSDFNLLVDNFPSEVEVKIRYSSNLSKAKLVIEKENIHVILDEPQKSITPGQSAVFYDNDIVIGGGKINKITS